MRKGALRDRYEKAAEMAAKATRVQHRSHQQKKRKIANDSRGCRENWTSHPATMARPGVAKHH